ncbi:hypothetical protein SAMN02910265_02755 [Ruminococcus flavefaciens]|uniref:Uncharacterized protein n=1 Tax=Ruminococcus flavefaciens TaxID=1265 RepID=A0A1H6KVL6_RUMFL|nr:hypothetical protein [Ruminococcus flavefaciens]SEH79957.1 hypothetical protein SAMN02910265_02755 [Ruminococcus flavefaciens]
MKILKIVLLLAALVCVGGVCYFETTNSGVDEKTLRVFCGMPESLISNLCFIGIPLFIGAAAVISLVERIRANKNGVIILGFVALICGGALGLIYAITGGHIGYFMHELESPNGNHSVYYVRNKETGDVAWLRKGNGHTYYIIKSTDTGALDDIEWKDDALSLDGEIFEYDLLDNISQK